MKKRPLWLLPVVTCLFIAAAAMVPQGLSRLRDQQTRDTVHTEALTGDINFSVWSPSMAERVELIVRWQEGETGLSYVSQDLSGQEREQVQATLRADLAELAEAGILPKDTPRFSVTFARRTGLWVEGSLGGVSVLGVSAFGEAGEQEGWYLSAFLDEESGKIVQIELYWPRGQRHIAPSWAGADFLKRLGADYRLLGVGDYQAFFTLADSAVGYQCISNGDFFVMMPDKQENIDLMNADMQEYLVREVYRVF